MGRPYRETWTSIESGYKLCRKCDRAKPVSDFGPRATGKDGLNSQCRSCISERKRSRRSETPDAREKEREYEQRPEVAARIRASRAARLYGMSVVEYQEMEVKQEGYCGLCGALRRLTLDHCHASGRVRRLLCYRCNVMLGLADDDVDLLKKAIEYVEMYSAV